MKFLVSSIFCTGGTENGFSDIKDFLFTGVRNGKDVYFITDCFKY